MKPKRHSWLFVRSIGGYVPVGQRTDFRKQSDGPLRRVFRCRDCEAWKLTWWSDVVGFPNVAYGKRLDGLKVVRQIPPCEAISKKVRA